MSGHRVYQYRWVVLVVYALMNAAIQLHWLNFAAITSEAAKFYNTSELQIAFQSMVFMIVFIILSVPASNIIDKYGLRIGVGIGVVLTGLFGLLKGFADMDFTVIIISQIALSVAQPFIYNGMTKIGATWFPVNERATAAGITMLAQYVGIIIAMAATPFLVTAYRMQGMLMVFGIFSIISAILFFIFFKEAPPTPLEPEQGKKVFTWKEGLIFTLKQSNYIILLIMFFCALGMFNAVTTWIEPILSPRGFNIEQAGICGGIMMAAGILGAAVIPALSDKLRKRKLFSVITTACIIPGVIGLAYCTSEVWVYISSFVLGFSFLSAGPILYQYATESVYPASESMAIGLTTLSGQLSGIIFIYAMDYFKDPVTKSMTSMMIFFAVIVGISAILSLFLKESKLISNRIF